LASVSLPPTLTTIGDSAFRDCIALTSIVLPASIASIGDGAFYGSSNLLEYTLFTDGSISVGRDAFRLSRSRPPGGTVFVLPEHLASFGGIDADWHGLNVALTGTPASPYSIAVYGAGLSGLDALPDATPFHDGVSNLIKVAFNMNLSQFDNRRLRPGGESGLPYFELVRTARTSVWRVEFLRRKNSGFHYAPMKTTSLQADDFQPITGSQTVTEVVLDEVTGVEWERVVIAEPVDLTTTPKLFSTVAVSLP
jgi:hypothetical protein